MDGDKLSWCDVYAGYRLTLDTEDKGKFTALPQTLAQYILKDNIKSDATMKTGTDGRCQFSGLTDGMYLVMGADTVKDGYTYSTVPALVILPYLKDGSHTLSYETELEVKHTAYKEPEKTKTSSVHVVKSWDDKGQEANRPTKVTVQLVNGGKVKDTVTLNKANNWRHTWTGLEGSGWYVIETGVDSKYTVDVTQNGTTFVVTNRYKSIQPTTQVSNKPTSTTTAAPKEKLPQTGQPWMPVFFGAGVGILLVVIGWAVRKNWWLSTLFIMAGVICIGMAGGLTLHNILDDEKAGQSADKAVVFLQNEVETVKKTQEEAGLVAEPDYELAESFPMPEVEYEGQQYIGQIEIESLDIVLPVTTFCNQNNLKIAPGRYTGSIYDDNCIIAGHNYKAHFGRLKNLTGGESVVFTDVDGNVFTYEVTAMEIIDGTDIEGMKSGDWDLTLFTCTPGGLQRRTIRCKRVN